MLRYENNVMSKIRTHDLPHSRLPLTHGRQRIEGIIKVGICARVEFVILLDAGLNGRRVRSNRRHDQ